MGTVASADEGCLSVPGIYAEVSRAETIRIKAHDRHGEAFEETLDGMHAVCLQHEMDHLEGLLFVDHISALKRSIILRRLTKQGELPSINALVDLANLVSIRYALPVAVFDQRDVSGGTIVRLANGDEPWADLGSSETEHPEPGEVIFADDDEQVAPNDALLVINDLLRRGGRLGVERGSRLVEHE